MRMRWFRLLLGLAVLAPCAACSLSQHAQTRVHRRPLEKRTHEYKTPESYKPRVSGYDEKTGKEITYDHKPRVELVDAQTQKYAMKWIGFDGQEKSATFIRADALDVVVLATASQTASGEYLYSYEVRNLPTGANYLKRFLVQTFAPEVKFGYGEDFLGGRVSKQIKDYSEGQWYSFADVSDHVQVNPGQTVTISFTSNAPPGLVECRASAETVVEGADEEVPSDLADLLVGYNEYLRGQTIGPDERLSKFGGAERARFLLDKLPDFRKLGWITEETLRAYEQRLKGGDLDGIRGRAEGDLKAEQITSEVFAILQAMK
jgi:hypothetical protein